MGLIKRKISRYEIDHFLLSQMRENAGLSVEQFASLIGWTASYQYQLERGEFDDISGKTMDELCSAFSRCGIKIDE